MECSFSRSRSFGIPNPTSKRFLRRELLQRTFGKDTIRCFYVKQSIRDFSHVLIDHVKCSIGHVRILKYQTWPIPRELLSGHQHSTGPVPSFWCQRSGFEVKGNRKFFASALSCISLVRSTEVPKTNECIFLGLQKNFLECCFCT